MYKIWTIEDIHNEITNISKKLNYLCNIEIQISKRAYKRMGAFFYAKAKNKIVPLKFVFAEVLINGKYPEQIVKEVIIHEYLHFYCDTKTGVSNGHNRYFKEMCIKIGISDKATFSYTLDENHSQTLKGKQYILFCTGCNKRLGIHKRIDAAKRKVKYYRSACCGSKIRCKCML